MCLAGVMVASWSLTQEVASSSPFIDEYFCHWKFSENIQEKLQWSRGTKLDLGQIEVKKKSTQRKTMLVK